MIKQEDIKDLELALYRKLLNINHDIRRFRKDKFLDQSILIILKDKRKKIDSALSAVKQLYIHYSICLDIDEQYRKYLQLHMEL